MHAGTDGTNGNGAAPARAARADAPRRIALVGNALPRRCGLATYTSHVREALARRFPGIAVDHYAMVDPGRSYQFAPGIRAIEQEARASYRVAADRIAQSGAELVWVQHEFGIFGGPAGAYLLDLLEHMALPVMITLHTVLDTPNPDQRFIMDALARRADRLVVMAEEARRILEARYGVNRDRIAVIAHGVPDRRYVDPADARTALGLPSARTILTFGLLSPGKGIEAMIEAMPAIVARCPQARYRVVGATHPHLLTREGEAYRERLKALAAARGVSGQIDWDPRFLDEATLLDCIAAADIYVTPYANPAQITSGTLAYAYGLGKPIVSTPYVHAAELLANGRGCLVGFNDPAALAGAVSMLLGSEKLRQSLAMRAHKEGRAMRWEAMVERAIAAMPSVGGAARAGAIPAPLAA